MEKYYSQTIGTAVIDENNNYLGKINDVVINADNGKIVGFFTASKKVISPIDIIEWEDNIIIGGNNDIMEIDEMQHFKETLRKNVPIYRNKVYTKDGTYLGKVLDYGIHSKFYSLTCIIVAKSVLNIIHWDKKLISSRDIIKIKKKRITVKDLVKPIRMKKLKVDMAADFSG
jgi:uncharacterized protein YrrD